MRVALIAPASSVRVPSVSSQESTMNAQDLLQRLPARARFAGDTPVKLDCFRCGRLLVGVDCFEPGQTQKVHAHSAPDKFHFVVSGKARFVLATHTREAPAGTVIPAPEG